MSVFANKCIESIEKGMGLTSDDFTTEVSVGVFDSGFNDNTNATNERFLDLRISKPIWSVVTAEIDIEIQGGYHTSFEAHYNKVKNEKHEPGTSVTEKKIKAARRFADQILRDQWIADKATAEGRLMLWIMAPEYDTTYDNNLEDLCYRLSTTGFLTSIIQECEKKGARGAVITHDSVKYIIGKRFPKPNIPVFMQNNLGTITYEKKATKNSN